MARDQLYQYGSDATMLIWRRMQFISQNDRWPGKRVLITFTVNVGSMRLMIH